MKNKIAVQKGKIKPKQVLMAEMTPNQAHKVDSKESKKMKSGKTLSMMSPGKKKY